jgi:hypothetical protein
MCTMTFAAAPAPFIATPSRPSRPRASGKIASGLASPATPESARSQRKVGRCCDHPAGRKRRKPTGLVHKADRVEYAPSPAARARIFAENPAKKIAKSTGKISRERLKGLRHSHVRKPQRKLSEHVVELFAPGRCIGKSLAHRPGEARRADAERIGTCARTTGRSAKILIKIVRQFVTFGDSVGQERHRDISSLIARACRGRAAESGR